MILRAFLAAILLCVTATFASAQIQVTAHTAHKNFLLYERIDVLVTVVNISDSEIELSNDGSQPWLSFMVTGENIGQNFMPVHSERTGSFAPLTLKVGETKTFDVNITPMYAIRAEGNYRVSAVINLPGAGQMVSDIEPFCVQRGTVVAKTVRTIGTLERIYSLVRFSQSAEETALYLRVESPSENVVYANIGLGALVSSVDPTLMFDPEGNIHILQPTQQDAYLYTRANADGKVIDQRIFKRVQWQARPLLAKLDDGSVVVNGGLAEDTTPREKLSDTQKGERVAGPVIPNGDAPRAQPVEVPVADLGAPGLSAEQAAPKAPSTSAAQSDSEWAPVSAQNPAAAAPPSSETSSADAVPAPGTVSKSPNAGP